MLSEEKAAGERLLAFRVACAYALVAACYILVSDQIAASFAVDVADMTSIELLKGSGFIVVTSVLLYHLIQRYMFVRTADQQRLAQLAREHIDVMEALPNILIVMDSGGNLIRWNRHAEELLGVPTEQLANAPAIGFLHPADQPRVQSALATLYETGIAQKVEARLLTRDGREFPFLWHSAPLWGSDKALAGVVGVGVDLSELKLAEAKLRESLLGTKHIFVQTIQAIDLALAKRDPYTAGHEHRVTALSMAMADEIGLSATRKEGLRYAALLHDIGKLAVPSDILVNPGRLTEAELEIAKSHAQHGYEILKPIDFPWPIAKIVRQHHERLDGSGYPDGLRGDEIVLEARILGVADTVDAMSSHRPYRPALGLEAALEEIRRHSGTRYDPDVVAACERLFERGFTLDNDSASTERYAERPAQREGATSRSSAKVVLEKGNAPPVRRLDGKA